MVSTVIRDTECVPDDVAVCHRRVWHQLVGTSPPKPLSQGLPQAVLLVETSGTDEALEARSAWA